MTLLSRIIRKMSACLRKHPLDMMERIDGLRRQGMKIGDRCYIGANVSFGRGGRDPIEVGDDCVLTGCTVLGHDALPALFLPELQGTTIFDRKSLKRQTVIGNRVFIGVNAVILPGVRVGDNSVIGAGAIVTKDIPAGSVAVGNPAQVVMPIEEFIAKHRRQYAEHPEYYYAGDNHIRQGK